MRFEKYFAGGFNCPGDGHTVARAGGPNDECRCGPWAKTNSPTHDRLCPQRRPATEMSHAHGNADQYSGQYPHQHANQHTDQYTRAAHQYTDQHAHSDPDALTGLALRSNAIALVALLSPARHVHGNREPLRREGAPALSGHDGIIGAGLGRPRPVRPSCRPHAGFATPDLLAHRRIR
jgi:hypothetical protein